MAAKPKVRVGDWGCRRVVADDPAALPEPGESGTIYEYEVRYQGTLMFTMYDGEIANGIVMALNEYKACMALNAELRSKLDHALAGHWFLGEREAASEFKRLRAQNASLLAALEHIAQAEFGFKEAARAALAAARKEG